MIMGPPSTPGEPSPQPRPPRPEELPPPSQPDAGPPPPDRIPAPQPDLVPTPPGSTPTMASGLTLAAALLWAAGGLGLHAAWAQAEQAPPPAPPEVMGDAPAKAPGAGSLSGELSRSKGVIAPRDPGVDPGMVQPAPDTRGTAMPVIPPPGSPEGDPNVRPQ